jgi:hypothetical protein
MDTHFKVFLGVVALMVTVAVIAGRNDQAKAEACKAQDGVYLYREGACLKSVVKIPATPPGPQVPRIYPSQSCPPTQFTCTK